jgi:hypothetical protein
LSSGKNKKKKKKAGGNNNNKPLAGAPTAAAATATADGGHGPRGDKWLRQLSGSDEGDPRCQVHNSRCHNMECREIKKLTEQFHKQVKQQPRQEGALSRQQKGK